jgi:squalene-hopene/tetraprenyl-beta-curcumene cyclase
MAGNFENSDKLKGSVVRAVTFLEDSRNSDGLWSDFLTLAGESVFWVSGYVGYALLRHSGTNEKENWPDKVGSNILAHQNADGGWGYGYGVPSDADSTSWCLLFLSRLGLQTQESRREALLFLLKHQSRFDGGFRTYAKPMDVGRYMGLDESVSFDGWTSSQMCVTGVAVQALIENNSTQGVEEALEYIRGSQSAEGYWNPYWWSGKLYATVNCMKALKANGNEADAGLLSRAQKWIAGTQLADGSWSDSPTQKAGWPFSTALALNGLLMKPEPSFSDRIRDGAKWLLDRQLTDGSWAPNHILRIPYPWVKDPWNQPIWKRDGKAINAVIKDHRRLYTTATAFVALKDYESRISKGETS